MEQVHAYLVRAPGMKITENKAGAISCTVEDVVVCDRGFSATRVNNCHFEAVDRMAANVSEDSALVRGRDALGDCEVLFFRGPVMKLPDQ